MLLSSLAPLVQNMKFFRNIFLLFKKRCVWIPLLAIGIIFDIIGLIAIIGIFSYQTKPNATMFGPWQYSYELSEKALLDTMDKNTEFYNTCSFGDCFTSSTLSHRSFGVFWSAVNFDTYQDGTETIRAKPSRDNYTAGWLYINGKKYSARLFSQTGEVTYDQSESYERSNWHWYSWMGLRMPQ